MRGATAPQREERPDNGTTKKQMRGSVRASHEKLPINNRVIKGSWFVCSFVYDIQGNII